MCHPALPPRFFSCRKTALSTCSSVIPTQKFGLTLSLCLNTSNQQSAMEDHQEQQQLVLEPYQFNVIPKPAKDCFTTLISLQADIIYNSLLALSSPFTTLFSVASDSYHRAEETTAGVEKAVQNAPYEVTRGGALFLKRVGLGLLGAAHVLMVLVFLMCLAAIVGIGLVQLLLEEPVSVREKVFFDYTEVNPTAVFCFRDEAGGFEGRWWKKKRQSMVVPVGHTFHVSLLLLLPESDFNRNIGVFQLSAELLSTKGNVIGKSSQPVMLQFRSLPVRLAQTFMMGIPLLLGISSETQKIKIEMLRYKERHPRSEGVRVILAPRAGTQLLPQLYEANIIMNSQLPWTKQFIHNWKWTLYVWTSLNVYILFLILLIACFRPLFFPATIAGFRNRDINERNIADAEEFKEPLISGRSDQSEVLDILSKWQNSRRKRKAVFLSKDFSDVAGSSASSMSVTREGEDMSTAVEEDVGDSESVCLGG